MGPSGAEKEAELMKVKELKEKTKYKGKENLKRARRRLSKGLKL